MDKVVASTSTWPAAVGEMARRIRTHDWGSTPLGPIAIWPQSLRTSVDIMLGMPRPANILWGSDHIQLYNDHYIAIAKDRHPALLGCPAAQGWQEAFDAVLAPRFASVFAGNATHEQEVVVSLRAADGRIEERAFETSFSPISDEAGAVAGILEVLVEVTGRRRAQIALHQSEARMWNVLDGMTEAFGLLAPDFTILEHNAEALRLDGRSRDQIVGRSHWEVYPDSEHNEIGRLLKHAMGERTPVSLEHRYTWAGGQTRWLDMRAYPTADGALAVFWRDVTDRKQTEARRQTLVAELQHRTRNLIAVVRSMADKTARASADLPDFRARFRDRLEALSRVQGLLSRLDEHDRVTFDELIETELTAMGGGADKITLNGPKGVRLRSSMVQTLAMALHELATNAVKYGALAQAGGHLAVTWRLAPEEGSDRPWLDIDWRESGVAMPPSGSKAQGGGQGRELIERALPYQLSARTSYDLGPDGVHCTISVPVSGTLMQETVDAEQNA